MNTSSYFIHNKALFGSYPNNDKVRYLEGIGVEYFVDLTTTNDNVENYSTTKTVIKFPIKDRKTPNNIKNFSNIVLTILKIIKELKTNEKIYIHCKGGHGRSGILVACLLVLHNDITAQEALNLTSKFHSNRTLMKEKWRKIGSPQTYSQRKFVIDLFNPIVFTNVSNGFKSGLSNLSNNSIIIDGVKYDNAEVAYHLLQMTNRNINTKNIYYIRKHYQGKYYTNIEQKLILMEKIIREKYIQNLDIKDNLLNIGLRQIIYNSKRDIFWGCNKNGGDNYLGSILTKIKNEYLLNSNKLY